MIFLGGFVVAAGLVAVAKLLHVDTAILVKQGGQLLLRDREPFKKWDTVTVAQKGEMVGKIVFLVLSELRRTELHQLFREKGWDWKTTTIKFRFISKKQYACLIDAAMVSWRATKDPKLDDEALYKVLRRESRGLALQLRALRENQVQVLPKKKQLVA